MGCASTKAAGVYPQETFEQDQPTNADHFEIERIIGQGGFGKASVAAIRPSHHQAYWSANILGSR